MQDTAKYLVHADITADGVVERSDVVGAVFGQTEGLLGDELDLRELQDASKVGRIDVEIDSQNGQSFGRITIATSLDQVETAILGAALETIDRVGPCRSTIEVRRIEDVRAAKRREVVERAKGLLTEAFDESMRSSRDLVEEVRESVRVEDITEYEGLPAGPNVADSDAIIVVEGRADVLTLLRYGIKNAVAVEGTNVPEQVAELTQNRTVTTFLDGDRGGDLILKELAQVGDVDYVAFAPQDQSVEDLSRHEVMAALREKVPYDRVDEETPAASIAPDVDEGASVDAPGKPPSVEPDAGIEADEGSTTVAEEPVPDGSAVAESTADGEAAAVESTTGPAATAVEAADETDTDTAAMDTETVSETSPESEAETETGTEEAESEGDDPETLRGHVEAVVGHETGTVRLLDDSFGIIAEGDADDTFDLVAETEPAPATVVVDGELSQRVLDVAAQRGIGNLVAASTGDFVKQPTSVRVRTADQLLAANEA
ncbi:DNA primase [Natronomonas halophila]|uniref:DNA primase DnaG n=1 Tax=Natronomonas halophila TaxID=2747817 RepID=UPI0015B670AE|nr:DNA primase DnaG [Natronomonas halophila]QLD84756.1 DNA primase [Natronomonas halophila]